MQQKPKFRLKYYHQAQRVELIRGGSDFFILLKKLIDEAEFEIHFQVYILEHDETGKEIIEALINAAKRGIEVYVVLDEYGSSDLPAYTINSMKAAGIELKWFKPVIQMGNMEFGRRMHHKILSVDENIAIVAGVNVANRYNDMPGIKAWLDFAILVEGITAKEIKQRCLQIWEKRYELKKRLKKFRVTEPQSELSTNNALVKVSVNDWLRGKLDIFNGYTNALNKAENEIIIVGGYFLPGRVLRKKMKDASARGVQVKVILSSISDVRFAKEATEYLYQWMLRNKLRIFEWKSGVLHGKVAVVDKQWSTVGSFNLNYLSTFESIELNLEVVDDHFSKGVSDYLSRIIENECIEITEEDYHKKLSLQRKLFIWTSFRLARWSMRLLNAFSEKPKILTS